MSLISVVACLLLSNRLTARGLTLIPVVDQERLVGIVTLQNLMHSMSLLAESRRLRKQMEEQL